MTTTDHTSEFVSSGSSPGDSTSGDAEPGMRSGYRAEGTLEPQAPRDILTAPPIRTTQRKRGKCMSRRKGQNPKLRIGTRSDGSEYFYFQYWVDVPGVDERSRRREIIGPVKTKSGRLTKTEAEAKKMKFLADLNNRF